jgi:hypothetical protein
MKEDITHYDDQALSLYVFNDEALYNLRRYPNALQEAITNLFHYTSAQHDVLRQDIIDDASEDIGP